MRQILLAFMALAVALDSSSAATRQKRKSVRHRAAEPGKFDPALVNSTEWNGGKEWATLRAQILLARAHFSSGELDGQSGDNFRRAISGFQKARNMQPSGVLDQPTWTALNADTSVVLQSYTITDQDAAGPFTDVPEDMMEQAKLRALNYSSLEEELGERFHVSVGLLKRMNPGVELQAGASIQVPDTGQPVQGKAAKVVITKDGTLTAVDQSGAVIAQYPCSSGSEHDPLPIGSWKIERVVRDPPFFYNPKLFWDASPEHTAAKIPPGPNNPVGVVWIDLSKEHYGIHGTPVPGSVGHAQSHGCIRLTNWDALELAGLVGRGTPVICQE